MSKKSKTGSKTKQRKLTVISEEAELESVLTIYENPSRRLRGLSAVVLEVELNSQTNTFDFDIAAKLLLSLSMLSPKFKDLNQDEHPVIKLMILVKEDDAPVLVTNQMKYKWFDLFKQ